MSPTYPVVAAIDFGTHGTGYAWTEVGDDLEEALRRQPQIRERWPGSDRFYPKDLSAVLIDPSGEPIAFGHEARAEWIRRCAEHCESGFGYATGFKMALKPDSFPGVAAPGAGTIRIDSVRKAFPLVVASLRRMHRMAVEEISSSGYLERQIRWCLTVPAIWDEAEKQLMRDAAREAGLPDDRDRLLLAIEPEAAAVYCRTHLARVLTTQEERAGAIAEAGTRFMVVDCGGGTVDITAYRVGPAAEGSRMTEIGKVSGGKLGSEYINQAFLDETLVERLGGEVVERARLEHPIAFMELADTWESQKTTATVRQGHGDTELRQPVYLPIPGEIAALLPPATVERLASLPGGSRHRIAVPTEEVKALFDTVVSELIELVEEQLAEMERNDGPADGPERLLLVGGMSNSEYVQRRLQRHFAGKAEIVVPLNPAAAVLFGAVQYGCQPSAVGSRRSRYTYGCQITRPFDASSDPERHRLVGPDGAIMCAGRFNHFVKHGETIESDHVTTEVVGPVFPEQTGIRFAFYRTTKVEPRYVDEPECEQIGELSVDFDEAMNLPLDQRAVMLEMRFGDTDISATGVNMHTNKRVHTTLRFDVRS